MIRFIVLDSTPLSMLTQRLGIAPADACKQWLARHTAAGVRTVVPEVVDYELRRELMRLNKGSSLNRLDGVLAHSQTKYLPITTTAMRVAARLWADARRRGMPTADRHALDVDVILAAQVMTSGLPANEIVVATSNVSHLSQFVPACLWSSI